MSLPGFLSRNSFILQIGCFFVIFPISQVRIHGSWWNKSGILRGMISMTVELGADPDQKPDAADLNGWGMRSSSTECHSSHACALCLHASALHVWVCFSVCTILRCLCVRVCHLWLSSVSSALHQQSSGVLLRVDPPSRGNKKLLLRSPSKLLGLFKASNIS